MSDNETTTPEPVIIDTRSSRHEPTYVRILESRRAASTHVAEFVLFFIGVWLVNRCLPKLGIDDMDYFDTIWLSIGLLFIFSNNLSMKLTESN